ncbi:conserved hypothetical protein [Halorhabdus utahensis DSM 12940]|uniref:RimK domain protein ATP-grasp n=1 Tax=Halorhabdus utahensis (strain DSM 12940 / JCM 11049 / AX-2) TaxID=519442 RepID=C7NTY7_HALUD|nr:hypothetical protein [Halorhabdus utahensis]ACV12232.1 conserved hypothetical protein [Halorhabdus utahensis DSM 12940]
MSGATGTSSIGLLCKRNKPVFTEVAGRLRNAGYRVRFFHPQSGLSPRQAADLSLIVNKKTLPVALPALWRARRSGTPLWNNLQATIVLSSRLVGLRAASKMGLHTPDISFEKPTGEYVAKGAYVWGSDPALNGVGDFYQELIPTEPVDYKYYAVNDGDRTHVEGRRVTSKLYGRKRFLSRVQPAPTITAALRTFIDRFDLRGIGVDFVKGEAGQYWAVDVNLAAGYRDTDLEAALTDSIIGSLPGE